MTWLHVEVHVFLLPPGWDASPSWGYPPPPSSLPPSHTHTKFTGTFLYTWMALWEYKWVMWRHCESKSVLAKSTTQCLRPGLVPRPLNLRASELTTLEQRADDKCLKFCYEALHLVVKAFKNGIAWSFDLITWWTQAVSIEKVIYNSSDYIYFIRQMIYFLILLYPTTMKNKILFHKFTVFLFQLLCTFTDKVHICLEDKNMYVWTLLSTTDCTCTCTCNYYHW